MSKSEYHLLYVLSEPPIPVAQAKLHGWSVGDVLSSPDNPALSSSDRFVVLDVNENGRIMALKISEMSEKLNLLARPAAIELKELGVFEPIFDSAVYCIYLDKVYFEPMITGKDRDIHSVIVLGRLSPSSMSAIIQQVLSQKPVLASSLGVKPSQTTVSYKTGSAADTTLTGLTTTTSYEELKNISLYQKFLKSSYNLERFLDFVSMAFDAMDYSILRDNLSLPKKTLSCPDDLNCDCDDHRQKAAQSDDKGPRNFWRTWDKMVHCAEKLKLNRNPSEILMHLSEISRILGSGEPVLHPFKPKPCYIQYLPSELLLGIIESFTQHWDRESIFNFGLTCHLFYEHVNLYLYRSIAISCKGDVWNKVVRMLPKHGHLTREIYLEAWDRRVIFENLRAIGDYCPNLERLDLNYPLRLDLTATEQDLPPKFEIEAEQTTEDAEPPDRTDEHLAPQAVQDVEMPDAMQIEEQHDGPAGGQANGQVAGPVDGQLNVGQALVGQTDGHGNVQTDVQTDGLAVGQIGGQAAVQTGGQVDGQADDDDDDDHAGGDGDGDSDSDDDDADDDADPNAAAAAAAAAAHAARIAAVQAQITAQKRACAEIDYIIKCCPMLQCFSIQWTGPPALQRFYQKIPKLNALRIWDIISDEDLVATGKKCRDLQRFYLDGQQGHGITLNGMIRFLNALHTKDKSKLKNLGLSYPSAFTVNAHGFPMDMDDDNDDDGMDDMGDMDDGDEDMGGDNGADNAGLDIHDNGPANIFNIGIGLAHLPPPMPAPEPKSLLREFLEVLSVKHPFLERLCLVGCEIKDELIDVLGRFDHLQSLDISKPTNEGLSAVGISDLVSMFRGKSLASLDLSRHRQMSEDDMDILTGAEGLKTLRYIKVQHCPHLKDKYMMDEWVHPDDFVMEDGTWRPRQGAGKSLLEIGDGFTEQWNE